MVERTDTPILKDPEAELERALIEEYLTARGHRLDEVGALPDAERHRLMQDATAHAAGRMAEIAARAHYVGDIHRHE